MVKVIRKKQAVEIMKDDGYLKTIQIGKKKVKCIFNKYDQLVGQLRKDTFNELNKHCIWKRIHNKEWRRYFRVKIIKDY